MSDRGLPLTILAFPQSLSDRVNLRLLIDFSSSQLDRKRDSLLSH